MGHPTNTGGSDRKNQRNKKEIKKKMVSQKPTSFQEVGHDLMIRVAEIKNLKRGHVRRKMRGPGNPGGWGSGRQDAHQSKIHLVKEK